jgi:hypothetical protein
MKCPRCQRENPAHAKFCLECATPLARALARPPGRHDLPSVGIAAELGMRPLIAHCHAGLAKVYRRAGKRTESDENPTAATAMYRDMGMTYWLERAARELEG